MTSPFIFLRGTSASRTQTPQSKSETALSESEEIVEINALKEHGDVAYENNDWDAALRYYNEALEIEEDNLDVLSCRTAVYIEMGDYDEARVESEKLLILNPEFPQGHYLLGVSLEHLHQYKPALTSFLSALDADDTYADVISDNIAAIVVRICKLPKKTLEKLEELDAYSKLAEIGALLLVCRQFDLCIKILTSAQKLETQQQGIQMKILQTLGNAHSALKHRDLAISLYQDCLSIASAAHDQQYQAKALVNIASLFMELGETHQALVYYEHLLDLEAELKAGSAKYKKSLPEFWTQELQIGLHLNLSLGYKMVGKRKKAVVHAKKYMDLVDSFGSATNWKAESYRHMALMYEIVEDYEKAIDYIQKHIKLCRQRSDKRGQAEGYGILGRCTAAVHNWKLALTFHDQHVAMAKKMKDSTVLLNAYELLGDTHVLKGNYNAATEAYNEMLSIAKNDIENRVNCCIKIGRAFKAQKRYQYGLYYYDEAIELMQDIENDELQHECEYDVACILQNSTQMMELERARKYFEKLIPVFETDIQTMIDEDEDSEQNLNLKKEMLLECYSGIQNVLNKLGNTEECLQFSERAKRRYVTMVKNYNPTMSRSYTHVDARATHITEMWDMSKISRVVDQQNSTILCYTLLPQNLLLWVLQPGKGLVRFYTHHPPKGMTSNEQIKNLCDELQEGKEPSLNLQYVMENRSLPLKGTELTLLRQKNEQKSKLKQDANDKETDSSVPHEKSGKICERRLYELLFAPIEDILSQLEEGSSIVIIPDKELYQCPFGVFQDWYDKRSYQRFTITYLSSFHMLERVTHNEYDQLRMQDDLAFERTNSSLGGLRNLFSSQDISHGILNFNSETPTSSLHDTDHLDPRKTSNPRLLKSGALRTPDTLHHIPQVPGLSRESTFLSHVSKSTAIPSPPQTPNIKALKPPGAPTPMERMLHTGTLSTLVTQTATKTDVISSTDTVTEFRQISDPEKCIVIGNPKLPEKLTFHGQAWHPPTELTVAQKECLDVAAYCDCTAIVGEAATKDRFMNEIQKASVLHIATYGCLVEGVLVLSPNPSRHETGPPLEDSYLVTLEDIVNTKICAKLVVLNCGWTSYNRDYIDQGLKLPSAFLAAGAQCVLAFLWPLPDACLEKFFFHLYQQLQLGSMVSKAVVKAVEVLQKDDKYSAPAYWSPFILVGKDVHVSLHHIRHAMLHQGMDRVEKVVWEELKKDMLNPAVVTPPAPGKDTDMHNLQEKLKVLLCHHRKQLTVVDTLMGLLDSALKNLHSKDYQSTDILTETVTSSEGGLDFLSFLGFHFQAKGNKLHEPYVVFPHQHHDNLLLPAFVSLKAITEMEFSPTCCHAVYELLPCAQETISHLIDVLAITKHASEVQLKISDLSVRPLWLNPVSKTLLGTIGYHQIGMLLNFNRVGANRKLLDACLRLLLAISSYKSPILMHKLDVNLLGSEEHKSNVSSAVENVRLPTLSPTLLPRNQLRMRTPWSCTVERAGEMPVKMRLARSKSDMSNKYSKQKVDVRKWHNLSIQSQADETLDDLYKGKPVQLKVKVTGSGSLSSPRVPIDHDPELNITQTDQRRDYAHYVLHQRINDISLKHRDSVRKLYLPFVHNA